MNDLRQRNDKIARIRSLDQAKLDSMAAVLAELDAHRVRLEDKQSEIETSIEELSRQSDPSSLDALRQTLSWSSILQQQWHAVGEQIMETHRRRDEMLDKVMEQRTTIRGWDRLLEQIDEEIQLELQRRESSEADDTYLVRRLGGSGELSPADSPLK